MAGPLHTGDMQARKPARHTSRLSHRFAEKKIKTQQRAESVEKREKRRVKRKKFEAE